MVLRVGHTQERAALDESSSAHGSQGLSIISKYDGDGRIDELTLGPIEQKRNAFDLFPDRGIEFHAERFDRCHKKISMSAEEGGGGGALAAFSGRLSHPSARGGTAAVFSRRARPSRRADQTDIPWPKASGVKSIRVFSLGDFAHERLLAIERIDFFQPFHDPLFQAGFLLFEPFLGLRSLPRRLAQLGLVLEHLAEHERANGSFGMILHQSWCSNRSSWSWPA